MLLVTNCSCGWILQLCPCLQQRADGSRNVKSLNLKGSLLHFWLEEREAGWSLKLSVSATSAQLYKSQRVMSLSLTRSVFSSIFNLSGVQWQDRQGFPLRWPSDGAEVVRTCIDAFWKSLKCFCPSFHSSHVKVWCFTSSNSYCPHFYTRHHILILWHNIIPSYRPSLLRAQQG